MHIVIATSTAGVLWCATALAEETSEEAPNGIPPATPGVAEEAAAPPLPPKQPPLRMQRGRSERLATQLQSQDNQETEVHWFQEGSKDQFLGLFSQEYGEESQGYALILHDNQQHPDWPGLVHKMRTLLPAGGWSTLAIALPDRWDIPEVPAIDREQTVVDSPSKSDGSGAPSTAESEPGSETGDETVSPPPDEQAPENEMAMASAQLDNAPDSGAESTSTTEGLTFTQLSVEYPPDEIPQVFQSRIQEGLSFLKAKAPMPVIIISIGSSATLMAKQAHELRMKDIAGLVVIDPSPIDEEGFDASSDASGLRIPVLDIAPQFNSRSNPKLRKQNAKRQSRTTFEQEIVLGSGRNFEGYESYVAKKIRGWAKRVIIDKSRFGYL